MKITLLFLGACLALNLVHAIDNRTGSRLNRPKFDVFGPRHRRAPVPGGIRVHPLFNYAPAKPTQPSVRKGEYICGNKVCKLTPGVEPQGCNGVCQYPVL